MGTLDAGKQKVEQYIMDLARSGHLEGSVDAVLWWPAEELDGAPPDGAKGQGGGASPDSGRGAAQDPVALRIYGKKNNWAALQIVRADLRACVESPEALKKYEAEIREALMGL